MKHYFSFLTSVLRKPKDIIEDVYQKLDKSTPKDDAPLFHAVETIGLAADSRKDQLNSELEELLDHNSGAMTEAESEAPMPVLVSGSVADIYTVSSDQLDETIVELKSNLDKLSHEQQRLVTMLDLAKQRQAIRDEGKQIIDKVINGEAFLSHLEKFESKLRHLEQIHVSVKDFLLQAQTKIDNLPAASRREVVLRFCRDDKLSRYLKAMVGFRCQLCGFTFELPTGGFYAETDYLEATLGEADDLSNIVVLCPNHQKMLHLADVSILDSTTDNVTLEINGKRHVIERLKLR
jgi:hypothetical protein